MRHCHHNIVTANKANILESEDKVKVLMDSQMQVSLHSNHTPICKRIDLICSAPKTLGWTIFGQIFKVFKNLFPLYLFPTFLPYSDLSFILVLISNIKEMQECIIHSIMHFHIIVFTSTKTYIKYLNKEN